jgi:hypothetical protein
MPLQGSLSIERMCQLTGVSRAGFYRSLQERAPGEEDMEVRSVIQQIAVEHRRRYGYRRISAELRRRGAISLADLFSAVRTAWPATRSAHSFLEFRTYPLNVLPSSFWLLDGDNPADPLIAREWRNVLPFCPSNGIGNENLSQIRWYIVYRARGDRFLAH